MDDTIPTPNVQQVGPVDPKRAAIQWYTARFLYLDAEYARLAVKPNPTPTDIEQMNDYDRWRRIAGRALLNERKVSRW